MKILIVTQWFDPEPTFKGLLFASQLRSVGHNVEILTGFPNYSGGNLYSGYKISFYQKVVMNRIVVYRSALYLSHDNSPVKRVANYVSFAASTAGLVILKAQKLGGERILRLIADYSMPNATDKVLRIIHSYRDYVMQAVLRCGLA